MDHFPSVTPLARNQARQEFTFVVQHHRRRLGWGLTSRLSGRGDAGPIFERVEGDEGGSRFFFAAES